MAKKTSNRPPATLAKIADMSVLLGSLPLLPGEDRADYERFSAAVVGEMNPATPMEWMWTNDIIYLEWEIIRFRRAKANLIRRRASDHVALSRLTSSEPDPDGDLSSVIAANIDKLETLDWMIARMEQRRNAACHQTEQHRINLGNRLRRAVEQVEDTEFRELNDQPSAENRAA